MKTKLLSLAVFAAALFFSATVSAQTAGSMTFNFTVGTPLTGTAKVVIGVWVETSAGAFVKTNILYTTSTKTDDHFPRLTSKNGATTPSTADGGAATGNDVTTGNNVGAITGATRSSTTIPQKALGAYSVTWDGKNTAGTTVPDGQYKVWYEMSNDANLPSETAEFVNTGFLFIKGASITTVNPASSGPMSAMTLTWTPSALSLDSVYKTKVAIYPNPSNGVVNVQYNDIPVSKIEVVNVLGQVVKSVKIDSSKLETTESIDLSGNANGLYIINVSTNETSSSYKVVLDK